MGRAWLFDHLARPQASLVSGGEHVPHELLHSVVSPILRTVLLFALSAVLAFILSAPANALAARFGNRLSAIRTSCR